MWLYTVSLGVNPELDMSCGAGNWGQALCCSSYWSLLALAMRRSNAFSTEVCTGSTLYLTLWYGFPNWLDREIRWVNSTAVQASNELPVSDKYNNSSQSVQMAPLYKEWQSASWKFSGSSDLASTSLQMTHITPVYKNDRTRRKNT